MGEKATLRMARQELEDLYLGVPDDSVDLTFKDLASSSLPAAAAHNNGEEKEEGNNVRKTTTGGLPLARSSTNIFTYRPILEEDEQQDMDGGGGLLQLSPDPSSTPRRLHHHHVDNNQAATPAAVGGDRRVRVVTHNNHNYRRPGIPHSNICALCNKYVYLFRHRCLVCGRVYCRRCVGSGMGDMTEGRKCIDCLGRRYSHRYIHRAGDTTTNCGLCCCFWGYYPNAKAVTAQELIWAEKGPAPRRRRPHAPTSSISASYASSNASMSIHSDTSMAMMSINIARAPPSSASSFVASSYAPNPHALPL